MASTFYLAPNPEWCFLDSTGRPAALGTVDFFKASDQVTRKPVYKDPAGTFPWENPITLDARGCMPVPIYWEDDTIEKYYVVVREAPPNHSHKAQSSGQLMTTQSLRQGVAESLWCKTLISKMLWLTANFL